MEHETDTPVARSRVSALPALLASLAIGLMATTTASAAALSNGSFETPVATGTFQNFAAGQAIGAWTVASGNVDLVHSNLWTAADGDQSVDLNGSTPGSLCQSFDTQAGSDYVVSFSMSRNGGAASATMDVTVDGTVFGSYVHNVPWTAADPAWQPHSLQFTASGASTSLCFVSTTTATVAHGPVVDAVALPQTLACSASTIFIAQGSPTQLSSLAYGSGGTSFAPIGPPVATSYNAIGFNPTDKLLYGVNSNGHIVRIDASGSVTDLGATSPASGGANVGAFDEAGAYYVMSGGTTTLYKIDLSTMTSTPIALSQAPGTSDLSFIDGKLWGQAAGTSLLVRVDPASGQVDLFSQAIVPASVAAGAAWTYGNGNLGLSDNNSGTLYQVRITDPSSAAPTFALVSAAAGPASGNNDGTSCISPPADLGISKSAPEKANPGAQIAWTLTVHNYGPGISSGYVVSDEVPASITGVQTATPGCGVSGNTVSCTGGALAVGEDATITITGTAPTDQPTSIVNAASVTGNEADPVPGNNSSSSTTMVDYPAGLCRGSPVRLLGFLEFGVANPLATPCETDANTVLGIHQPLGLGSSIDTGVITGTSTRGFGVAAATANVANASVTVLGIVSLQVNGIDSQAKSQAAGGCGMTTASGSSLIAGLKLNGVNINVGTKPLTIPLVVGALYLNQTVVSGSKVSQRALFLDLPGTLLDVVLGEAVADVGC